MHSIVYQNLTVNLTMTCEENMIVAYWELSNRQNSDEIDGYRLQYWCNTTTEPHHHTVSSYHTMCVVDTLHYYQ